MALPLRRRPIPMWRWSAMPVRCLQPAWSRARATPEISHLRSAGRTGHRSQQAWLCGLLGSLDEAMAFIEKLQHGLTAFEICPVGGESDAVAGARNRYIEHFADAG